MIRGVLKVSTLLAGLAVAAPLLAGVMHEQYLPPDEAGLSEQTPDVQQLMQVSEFSVVAGNQRVSNQQPIPVTSPLWLRLKGKPLNKGATLNQVLIGFDAESKSLRKPVYDEASQTLTLNYPLVQYRVLVELLRTGNVYVQYLQYANGHVWADVHTGAAKVR